MQCSRLKVSVLVFLAIAVGGSTSLGALLEPLPRGDYRPLRTDYVKTWYIYSDLNVGHGNTNGILDPGDTIIGTFKNWWTPVSSHSQHNYSDGPYGTMTYAPGDDMASAPQNYANLTTASANYWIDGKPNTMQFFMSYSQFDNNDFTTYFDNHPDIVSPDDKTVQKGRNMEQNGYVWGWNTHEVKFQNADFVNDQTPAGNVQMDIFVHNGQGTYNIAGLGTSRSNPELSVVNDIDPMAKDPTPGRNTWYMPTFEQTAMTAPGGAYDPGSYDPNSTTNAAYRRFFGPNGGVPGELTLAEFAQIVGDPSVQPNPVIGMETREVAARGAGGLAPGDSVVGGRTPNQILATLVDDNGNPYTYDDAFVERSEFVESSTDGAVIAGLAGQTSYDPRINNWGDQQVIRIDISEATLTNMEGGPGDITKIIIYDFGNSIPGTAGTQQTDPEMYVFLVDLTQTYAHGQLYYDTVGNGTPADFIYFPENRIYIAQVEIVPEPGTMALLTIGVAGPVLRRRRRRQ